MNQILINKNAWIDIHGTYYIVKKMVTELDDLFLL